MSQNNYQLSIINYKWGISKSYWLFLFFTVCIQLCFAQAKPEIRAIWVTPWDLNSPEKVDQMLSDAVGNNINQILAEVRYRGDALYTPNRKVNYYPNLEQRSYILADNPAFDPLDYLLKKAHAKNMEVYAWMTIFVTTPKNTNNLPSDHVWFTHPEWFTYHREGRLMQPHEQSGAFLDPGVPEAREYILGIIKDVCVNYDIDGLQMDYIRYPTQDYGYNPTALKLWQEENKDTKISWQKWKEKQVSLMAESAYFAVKEINPQIQVTASVIANQYDAINAHAQNWPEWITNGYIDKIYLMAYNMRDDKFGKILEDTKNLDRNKIVVGLRAWTDAGETYAGTGIVSKIKLVREQGFPGFALFSYSGLLKNDYISLLKPEILQAKAVLKDFSGGYDLYGYVSDQDNKPISNVLISLSPGNGKTTSDENGFYQFPNLNAGVYEITVLQDTLRETRRVEIEPTNNRYINQEFYFQTVGIVAKNAELNLNIVYQDFDALFYWELPVEPETKFIFSKGQTDSTNFLTKYYKLYAEVQDSLGFWQESTYRSEPDISFLVVNEDGLASKPVLATVQDSLLTMNTVTRDLIEFSIPKIQSKVRIYLYDRENKLIQRKTLDPKNRMQKDKFAFRSALKPGVYFLVCENGTANIRRPIVVF